MSTKIKEISDQILELIFPTTLYCICCNNIIDDTRPYSICDHCMDRIKWRSGDPILIEGIPSITAMEYGMYERKIIFRLKYNQHRYIARKIAEIMADRIRLEWEKDLEAVFDFDIILPVPMHKRKEKERGFNHAALISKYLALELNKKVLVNGLLRVKATLPMRGLGPQERRSNIEGAFSVNLSMKDRLAGKKILIVDDFSTTGSTLYGCKIALEDAGVKIDDMRFIAFASKNIT